MKNTLKNVVKAGVVSLGMMVTGCASMSQHDLALSVAYGGIAMDAGSTYYQIGDGNCVEANPLWEGASTEGLMLINAGLAGLVYLTDGYLPDEGLWLIGVLKGGVGAYNMTLDCH